MKNQGCTSILRNTARIYQDLPTAALDWDNQKGLTTAESQPAAIGLPNTANPRRVLRDAVPQYMAFPDIFMLPTG